METQQVKKPVEEPVEKTESKPVKKEVKQFKTDKDGFIDMTADSDETAPEITGDLQPIELSDMFKPTGTGIDMF